MIRLTLYSRPGCHLCDDMKAVVRQVSAAVPISVDDIDISGDPELERLYGLDIPVLLVDGTKVAKYRIAEGELVRILEKRRAKG